MKCTVKACSVPSTRVYRQSVILSRVYCQSVILSRVYGQSVCSVLSTSVLSKRVYCQSVLCTVNKSVLSVYGVLSTSVLSKRIVYCQCTCRVTVKEAMSEDSVCEVYVKSLCEASSMYEKLVCEDSV